MIEADTIPDGANRYPTFCEVCGQIVPAGAGNLVRRRGARKETQGPWAVEHDNCPGAREWQLQNSGWVYAITGAMPAGCGVKVGMTGISLADRIIGQFGKPYLPSPLNVRKCSVWASPTPARYLAEATAHQILIRYRVHPSLGLGREVFEADLSVVLDALKSATGTEPRHFPWDVSGSHLRLLGVSQQNCFVPLR